VAGAAERAERVPGRVHLLDVRDERGPPAGHVPGGRGGSGMDEQRQVPVFEQVEQGGAAGEPVGVRQRGGGELEAGEALAEGLGGRVGVDRADVRGGPGAERRGQRGGALVVGVQQRTGLVRRQRLDAERRGQRDERAAEAVGAGQLRAGRDVVVLGVDREGRLTVEIESPLFEVRRSGAGAERGEERLGPEVLVDVDGLRAVRFAAFGHAAPPPPDVAVNRFSEPLQKPTIQVGNIKSVGGGA
jgi:hypothetical protein